MGNEKFSCPHCGLLYNFRPDWAGQKAKCKCCKNVFTVPDRPTTVRDSKSATSSAKKSVSSKPATLPKAPASSTSKPAPKENAIPEAAIVMEGTPVAPVAEAAPALAQTSDADFLEPIDELPTATALPIAPAAPAATPAPDPLLNDVVSMNDPLANFGDPLQSAPAGTLTAPAAKRKKQGGGFSDFFVRNRLACILVATGVLIAGSVTVVLIVMNSGDKTKQVAQNNPDGEQDKTEPNPPGPNPFDSARPNTTVGNPYKTSNFTPHLGSNDDNPFGNSGSGSKDNNPFGNSGSGSKDNNPFGNSGSGSNDNNPFGNNGSSNKNPFETTGNNTSNDSNPFETTGNNTSNNSTPFETTGNNTPSYETPDENPFQTPTHTTWPGNTTPNPTPTPVNVTPTPPDPDENTPAVTGVNTVSVDRLLKRLKSGSTGDVTKVLKVLARQTPVNEKREEVSRAMVALMNNRRYSFADEKAAYVLAKWQSPKVTGDVVKIINRSNGIKDAKKIEQLAQIPDDQIAAAVVDLWMKNSFFLENAVPPLGTRAEKPLWKALDDSNDSQLRIKACEFLTRQGTAQSLPKLRTLKDDSDDDVVEAAEKAIEALSK